jgi:hypothetical protein
MKRLLGASSESRLFEGYFPLADDAVSGKYVVRFDADEIVGNRGAAHDGKSQRRRL